LYRRKLVQYISFDHQGRKLKDATYQFIRSDSLKGLSFNAELDNLEEFGVKIKKASVKSIYIIHGTFVGEDPFHLIGLLESSLPAIGQEIIQKIRQNTKKGQDLFTKDLGNFIEDHVDILSSMTLGSIPVHNLTWSSGNHHYARVKGALKLIEDLSSKHNDKDRVLLIGHSHAGQLFALLSQFCDNKKNLNQILSCINSDDIPKDLESKLKKISNLSLDFVTLGTPFRYEWKLGKKMRALHIINHRGNDILAGSTSGATFTKDGDYIQQWGIAGSDIKSPVNTERLINEKLDEFLGVGTNFDEFKLNIKKKNRIHNQGHHLLVDYGDSSKIPNMFQTVLGHGCYTRIKHLRFLISNISQRFYE
jgi:hypothetical protein